MMKAFKFLLIASAVVVMTGCKLQVIVSKGGSVASESDTRNCYGGKVCEFEVTDAYFAEAFTAEARVGYVFSHWASGDGFLCVDSVNPTCVVSNVALGGNSAAEAIIASEQVFYIRPVFTGDGEPIAELDVRVTSGAVLTNSHFEVLGEGCEGGGYVYFKGNPFRFSFPIYSGNYPPFAQFESEDCTGSPLLDSLGSLYLGVTPDHRVYMPDTTGEFFTATSASNYNHSTGICTLTTNSTPRDYYLPVLLTNIELPDGRLYDFNQ
jgi:hypothetical protein